MPDNHSIDVPVEIAVSSIGASGAPVTVTPTVRDNRSIVLQRTPALFAAPDGRTQLSDSAYCGLISANVSSGTLSVQPTTDREEPFSFVEQDGRVTLLEGDHPVLAYNHENRLPKGIPPEYERSSYVHPIWDLEGTVITEDFPTDHYHHRGLSWMWPRVFVDGKEYDLWALRGIAQVFDQWLVRDTGPVCATIGVKNHWEMMEGGRNVVDEWVWLRTYRAGEIGQAIDVRITLEANEPIGIAGRETDKKGYGGFSLRFGPREATTITSSDGLETNDSDHKQLPWADESGRFRGASHRSGIAIFQHAQHPDFPAQWTLRHYGFLGVAWPNLSRVQLEPGVPLTLRYRLWVHRGGAKEGRVAEAYSAFKQPPVLSRSD